MRYFISLILILINLNANASTSENYTFVIGAALGSVDFSVYEPNSSIMSGRMTAGDELLPIITIDSPINTILIGKGEHQFKGLSWLFRYGYKSFRIDQQIIGSGSSSLLTPQDLGTSVDGHYIYINPSIRIDYDQLLPLKNKLNTTIGLGLGYLKASGDIIMTEGSGLTHTFNINRVNLGSINIDTEFTYGNILYRLQMEIFSVVKNDYEYRADNILFMIGYQF